MHDPKKFTESYHKMAQQPTWNRRRTFFLSIYKEEKTNTYLVVIQSSFQVWSLENRTFLLI